MGFRSADRLCKLCSLFSYSLIRYVRGILHSGLDDLCDYVLSSSWCIGNFSLTRYVLSTLAELFLVNLHSGSNILCPLLKLFAQFKRIVNRVILVVLQQNLLTRTQLHLLYQLRYFDGH